MITGNDYSGYFDNDEFRRAVVARIIERKESTEVLREFLFNIEIMDNCHAYAWHPTNRIMARDKKEKYYRKMNLFHR